MEQVQQSRGAGGAGNVVLCVPHAVGAGAGGVGVHALAPVVKEQELNQEQQAAYLLYGLVLWQVIPS